jgi:hypothetical protein
MARAAVDVFAVRCEPCPWLSAEEAGFGLGKLGGRRRLRNAQGDGFRKSALIPPHLITIRSCKKMPVWSVVLQLVV